MTRLGDIDVTEVLCHETAIFTNLNANQAPSTTVTYTLGTYTMPLTGQLSASLIVQNQWTGQAQQISGVLTNSTPSPTAGEFGFIQSANGLGPRTVVVTSRILALWPVMAIGTLVTLKMTIDVAGFACTPTITNTHVYLRSCKA